MAILTLKTLEVLDPPGDAGSHIELQIRVNTSDGEERFPPGDDGHSMNKEQGATWPVSKPVPFEGSVGVSLWETDSSSPDDFYGEQIVMENQPKPAGPNDNPLQFGKPGDCSFTLSYSVSKK